MGEDKALLPFAGFTTLAEYQYNRLCKIFTNVYISCKDKKKFPFQAQFIEDKKESDTFAPTLAFVTLFEKLEDQHFFVISVDTPFIDETIIYSLVDADSDLYDATIAKLDEKTQPLCGIYHRSLANKFHQMLKQENHKLGFLLKNSHTHYLNYSNQKAFMNLNDKTTYKKALKTLEN